MKIKSVSIAIGVLAASLLLFQNCGKKDDSNKEVVITGNSVTEKVVIRDFFDRSVKLGKNIDLVAPKADYDLFATDGECEWVFKNTTSPEQILGIDSHIVPLTNAQSFHFGTYKLTCKSPTLVHEFIFKLSQDTSIEPVPIVVAKYVGEFTSKGLVVSSFETADNISEANALKKCKAKDSANATKGIKCTWGSKVIHNRKAPNEKDNYKGVFIVGGKRSSFASENNISEAQALTKCKAEADKAANATKGVECKWATLVIFKRAEPPPKKDKFVGSFIVNAKSTAFATVDNITEADALAQCKAEANKSANVNKGVLCKWGAKDIFKRAEVIEKRDGKLYVENRLQRTVQNVTRAQALVKCDEGKLQVPKKYNMKCLWGSEVIFEGKGKK